jgi:hypothetical protein
MCPFLQKLAPNRYRFVFQLEKVNDLMADVPYAFPDGGRKQLPTFIQRKCLSGMDESIRALQFW